MLLNCGVGEDSWESLGLQGDQTSQSLRKSVLNIHWQDWCWSWNSNTLATWWEELTHCKDHDAGKDWRQEEKGMTDDEIFQWHHWLYGHEFEQAPGVGDGQGDLVCCSPWGCKELDTTEWLNWTELNWTVLLHMWTFPEDWSSVVSHLYALSPGKLTHIHSLITTCTHMRSPIYISISVLLCDLQTGISKCLLDWSERMSESLLRLNLYPKPGPLAAFPISVDWSTILSSGT